MGVISCTFQGSTIGTTTMQAEADGDKTERIIAYLGRKYGVVITDKVSMDAVLMRWFRETVEETTRQTVEDEKGYARASAEASVTPIEPVYS